MRLDADSNIDFKEERKGPKQKYSLESTNFSKFCLCSIWFSMKWKCLLTEILLYEVSRYQNIFHNMGEQMNKKQNQLALLYLEIF